MTRYTKYRHSEKGVTATKRFYGSPKYKIAHAKYAVSLKGKAAAAKYLAGPRGKAARAARFANAQAKRRGLSGKITVQQVVELFESQSVCQQCGVSANLTLDHVVALANGGANTIENCQVLCNLHNNAKGSRQ